MTVTDHKRDDRRKTLSVRTLIDRYTSLPVLVALLVAVVVAVMMTPGIVAPAQWPLLMRQAAPLGIIAIAQMILLIGRGFDMSVGGVVGLISVLAAGSHAQVIPAPLFFMLCLVIGGVIGAVNGIVVAWGKVSPLIATLAMGFILTGLMLLYTGGAPTGRVPDEIRMFSFVRFLGLPLSVWVWVTVGLVIALVLKFTWSGKQLLGMGSAPAAAAIMGVRTKNFEFWGYVLSGALAALAGLMLAGFVGIGSLGAGQDLVLNSIAAAVVGGTAMSGGKGSVVGVFAGVMLLTLIGAVLTAVGVGAAGTLITQCLVFIVAAALFKRQNTGKR